MRVLAMGHTNLCGSCASFQIPWHKQVDDGSADPLRSQDESQRPPKA